jgi:hypothetical protein
MEVSSPPNAPVFDPFKIIWSTEFEATPLHLQEKLLQVLPLDSCTCAHSSSSGFSIVNTEEVLSSKRFVTGNPPIAWLAV